MPTYVWTNAVSGNNLLSDGIKPLPEPHVDLSSKGFYSIHMREISREELIEIKMSKVTIYWSL